MSNHMPPARRWCALAALTLPVLVLSIDITVLGFALPALSESLSPSGSQLLWIVDMYGFVLAGLLVLMGVMGDRVGRRKLLVIGSACFAAASALAAFAPTAEVLIAARALMGVGGATLMPSTLSIVRNIFTDPGERRRAIGVWAAAFAGGAGLGPIVGGLLLESFWWGAVFLVNVPLMALIVVVAPVLVPESRDPSPGRLDLASAVLTITTVLPVVYGLKHAAESLGVDLLSGAAVLVGVASGVAFVRRQRKLDDPMLDISLLRSPAYATAVLTNVCGVFALVGALFFLPQFLQLIQGRSPLEAGVLTLPAAGGAVLGALAAAALADRFRATRVIGGGLVFAAIGFVVATQFTEATGIVMIALGTACIGAGIGATEALTNDVIVTTAPPDRAGAAAALSETAYELGGALGVAILGTVGTVVYRREIEQLTNDSVPSDALDAATETLGAAAHAAAEQPPDVAEQLLSVTNGAFVDGQSAAFFTAAAVLLCAAGLQALGLLRTPKTVPVSTRRDSHPAVAEER